MKNRGFGEMQQTFQQRNGAERNFFEKGRWQELPPSALGVDSLRTRLSDLLLQHVKRELPGLQNDLEAMYGGTFARLCQFGQSRATLPDMRSYLIKLSTDF